MRAKLLGAVTAAALLGSIGVASAQEPIQLTDAQLDAVTSGTNPPTAFLAIAIQNGALVNPHVALSVTAGSGPEVVFTGDALVTTGFAPNGPGASLAIQTGLAGIETP